MINKVLKDIAYLYYPKGIDNIKEKDKYLNSREYDTLLKTLNKFKGYKNDVCYINIVNSIKYAFNDEILISDCTQLNWEDRCITFEIDFLENTSLKKICINISFLIPFYTIYLLENEIELNPYRWITIPKRNRDLENSFFKQKINNLSNIIETEIGFSKIQDSLLDKIIPNINFNDIELEDFNFFNAFFLNENKFK